MRNLKKALLLGATVCSSLCWPEAAPAQEPPPQRAERLFSPGRNAASEDSSESIVSNPANLGFLPAWELRYNGVRCPDDVKKVGCGHSFGFATPLLWNIGTGLRFDIIQPPWGADQSVGVGFPFRGQDYYWLTWGLGVGLGDSWAFGMSLQHSYSQNPYLDSLNGITAALSFRPYRQFGFSVIAHDFNGPANQIIPFTGQPILDRSYVFSMAFRPTGRRDIEAGFEMKYLEGTDQWLPRGTLGVDIPSVGRARAGVEMAHFPNDERRSVTASAGLDIAFDHVTVGGGAFFGNGLGGNSDVGEYWTASIGGARTPGVPGRQHAVYMRIEDTPGARAHTLLLRRLWAIARDPEIAAVTLVLKAEPAESLARAEELADALRLLRAHHKKTMCAWENAGAASLYVCANADRTVVAPAGGLRYIGLKSQYMYLAGLLDKIGVKVDGVRIGAHKTAPEEFMNEHGSDTAHADYDDLLRQREAVFVRDVANGRKISEDQVRAETLKGPFIGAEAKDAGFVDAVAFDDEVERATDDLVGFTTPFVKYEDDTLAPSSFGPQPKIAILYVDGDITDGRSSHIPLLNMNLVGSYTMVEQIKQLKDDPTVRAVVMRIDSPGGSSDASEVMWRELQLLADKKPLIVSMGSVAASGGYYIAAPAQRIFALPLTVTGSIGIFYIKPDVSGLLDKLGVHIETYKTTPHADADSLYRPFTTEERAALQRKVQQFYEIFLDRVSRGRHMSKEAVDAIGQGRVWTGQEAIQHRLVDEMGGLRHALEYARTLTGLPDDATIAEYPPVQVTLLDWALATVGISHAQAFSPTDVLPAQILKLLRAVAPAAIYGPDVPLARMEYVPVDDVGGNSVP